MWCKLILDIHPLICCVGFLFCDRTQICKMKLPLQENMCGGCCRESWSPFVAPCKHEWGEGGRGGAIIKVLLLRLSLWKIKVCVLQREEGED